jgi:hypothetical protein
MALAADPRGGVPRGSWRRRWHPGDGDRAGGVGVAGHPATHERAHGHDSQVLGCRSGQRSLHRQASDALAGERGGHLGVHEDEPTGLGLVHALGHRALLLEGEAVLAANVAYGRLPGELTHDWSMRLNVVDPGWLRSTTLPTRRADGHLVDRLALGFSPISTSADTSQNGHTVKVAAGSSRPSSVVGPVAVDEPFLVELVGDGSHGSPEALVVWGQEPEQRPSIRTFQHSRR